MRILLIGKAASITHWLEHTRDAFVALGHQVRVAPYRNPALHPAIDAALNDPALGSARAAGTARLVRRLAPDLVLVIGAFSVPVSIVERLSALPQRPPLVGWVGDSFGAEAAPLARAYDLVGHTDSGLLARHRDLGFTSEAFFLPHAVDPARRHRLATTPGERREPLSFVAVPTPHRRAVVAALIRPIALHGPGWTARQGGGGKPRRLSAREVAAVYAGSRAVLNIRHESNVVDGLNQRSFEPYLFGAAVLSDAQPDLPLCFAPEEEVLVFRSPEELNALHGRITAEPDFAAAIAAAGKRRVVADHTFAVRLEAIRARL